MKDEPTYGGDGGGKPKAVGKPRGLSQTPHCRKSRAWHRAFAKEMLKNKGKSIRKAYKAATAAHAAETRTIKAETALVKKGAKPKIKTETARVKKEAGSSKTD